MDEKSDGWITSESQREVEGRRIVLEARAFRLRRPFGGLVWNRPVAVRVQAASGEVRLPIRDVTRRGQIAAYGVCLLCLAAGLSLRGRAAKEK